MLTSSRNLKDKTILLFGPQTSLHQNLAMGLTEAGADVAFICKDISLAQRFARNISDTREVNSNFGRSIAVCCDMSSTETISSAIKQVAESFGGVDVIVDGNLSNPTKSIHTPEAMDDIDRIITNNLKSSLLLTHASIPFLVGRKRGRLIFMYYDAIRGSFPSESINSACRSGLSNLAQSLAKEVSKSNVTVNCISLGPTEEYLTSRFPEESSLQGAFERLREVIPDAKLVVPDEISGLVAFLASPLSSGVNGQTIRCNHGLS